MSEALVRTFSFLLLIGVGVLLKGKIKPDQRSGIKQIILSIALPAVIFISLQKVEFTWDVVAYPFLALALNFVTFLLISLLAPFLKMDKNSQKFRTIRILIPSLAPGLSCFPFILEYLGEGALADAAFADIGNKFFVLVVLYAISMRWYYRINEIEDISSKGKLVKFFKVMLNEPVNLAIIAALVLVAFGVDYSVFPEFIRSGIDKLGSIMTPLILLFIGVSVNLNWTQAKQIASILTLRSALAFLLSGVLIIVFQITDPVAIILIVIFPQSSVSFWPFLHMTSITSLESINSNRAKTFDTDFAMNILAMSLPFSTLVILTICTLQSQITTGYVPLLISVSLIAAVLLTLGVKFFRKSIYSGRLAESESNS